MVPVPVTAWGLIACALASVGLSLRGSRQLSRPFRAKQGLVASELQFSGCPSPWRVCMPCTSSDHAPIYCWRWLVPLLLCLPPGHSIESYLYLFLLQSLLFRLGKKVDPTSIKPTTRRRRRRPVLEATYPPSSTSPARSCRCHSRLPNALPRRKDGEENRQEPIQRFCDEQLANRPSGTRSPSRPSLGPIRLFECRLDGRVAAGLASVCQVWWFHFCHLTMPGSAYPGVLTTQAQVSDEKKKSKPGRGTALCLMDTCRLISQIFGGPLASPMCRGGVA